MIGFGLQGGAMAGYVDVTGWPDRSPIAPWGRTPTSCRLAALAALVAALRHRDRVGVGQYIDVSQNEAGVHHLGPLVSEYAATGNLLERPGTAAEAGAPSGVFALPGASGTSSCR